MIANAEYFLLKMLLTPKNGDTELWSKVAYHENCIECHEGEIKHKPKDTGAPKKSAEGPTKCAECHEKKE